ncbi:hypothetical protein OAK91_05050 [Planctomycetaceae bacterium]|nr:hypothetical protein [Planctomycetaceae bacterium]
MKLRILGRHLDSTRGMDENDLTQVLIKDSNKISAKKRVLESFNEIDPNVDRRNLKEIILHVVLLQEETYSLEEQKLEEKVLSYEKDLVKRSKNLDMFDPKKHDAARVRSCDTYKIVLEAAWRNEDDISIDEANLLRVLRDRLGISSEDHRLISAMKSIKKFPKDKCVIHSVDEIHDARKELQREGLLWSYRDENNNSIDIIPAEIAEILRSELSIQLQGVNIGRLLQHDFITVSDLRDILKKHQMDPYGQKSELIERIAESDVLPKQVLEIIDRGKLADMCRSMELRASGTKPELIERLIEFYDDLSYEERITEDEREEWFNNYELLASRSYADLRAKKVIKKDLDVEHQFEKATDFLFEELLNLKIDRSRKVTKADGRIIVKERQVMLWDCKSVEVSVNLQDHLEEQFDQYLRQEREKGFEPLAFLVIAPSFTAGSMKLAHQYKARTNWDVALIQADAMKLIAERWFDTGTEQPFPIGLFNRTELIDRDRAEFLLSLA